MIAHEKRSIDKKLLEKAMTYDAYRQLIDELLIRNQTTGENNSEKMVHYTELNVKRMKRLDKLARIFEAVEEAVIKMEKSLIWLVITEGWCGDAAQNVPVIEKIARLNANISTRYILRDQYPEVIEEFLTNGTRSIPKLICLDSNTLEVLGDWGPRPEPAKEMIENYKLSGKALSGEIKEDLHLWYARDKGFHLQNEFLKLIREWSE